MFNSNNRSNMVLPGLILLVIGAAAMAESQGGSVIFILLGLLFLVRQFESRQQETSNRRGRDEVARLARQQRPQAEPVYKHALQAVTDAGQDPDSIQVLPVDIGIMAFKNSSDPVVHRTWPVPDDVDYVQPFVQLRLPTRATGRVRFEVVDMTGEPLFVHEDNHQLVRGRNLVTPSARLPVHDAHDLDGMWELRVSADNVLLAVHRFEWIDGTDSGIRQHLGEDGEISTELRAAMAESRLEKMSLDELLSYQEEDMAQQRG